MAVGGTDVVPGVSGGTMAFVLGIYTQLLNSVKQVTGTTPRLLLQRRFREAFASIPFGFLLPVGIGALIAGFSLASLISWLLSTHPVYVWAFFFGLVGASVVIVLRRVHRWSVPGIAVFGVAVVAAYLVTSITGVSTPETPIAFFLAGAVAICAMILPGISGAFLLIILGKYDQVLDAVAARDILTLLPFFLGAGVGISLFSRAITWLFDHYHDIVILFVAGLMLGSLPRIWPWKAGSEAAADVHDEVHFLQQTNVMPGTLNGETIAAFALIIIGAVLITVVDAKRRASTDEEF